MENFWIYFAYFLGAIVKLGEKLTTYLYNAKAFNSNWKKSLKEWFLEKTVANGASWGGTILFVWLIGYLFIEQAVAFPVVSAAAEKLPVAVPVVCVLGYLAESTVPEIIKKITAKILSKFS